MKRIRVLVVDDSLVFREVLARGLASDPGLEVVGAASNPFEARDLIQELEPDVMTLDVQMPRMDGIEFLRRLMPQYPMPVVVISAVSNSVFDALDAGAVDFVTKPDSSALALESFLNEIRVKIKIASTAKVGKLKVSARRAEGGIHHPFRKDMVIAIGASTGGTDALFQIIRQLPAQMPGILVVQHMPPVFTRMYAERLNDNCPMEVREAKDGDEVLPGRVLIAPGEYHMALEARAGKWRVNCYEGEKVSGHRPSVDVLFDSVSKVAGRNAVGVILTGMGHDGAGGLLKMRRAGAQTLGQDEKSCVVYGMPMVAFNLGAVAKQLPLERVAEELIALAESGR